MSIEDLIRELHDPVKMAEAALVAARAYSWTINGVTGVGTIEDLAIFVHPEAANAWLRDVGWSDLPGEFPDVGELFTHPSYDSTELDTQDLGMPGIEYGEATLHFSTDDDRRGHPSYRYRFKLEPRPHWIRVV